jgi:hypothetical protein
MPVSSPVVRRLEAYGTVVFLVARRSFTLGLHHTGYQPSLSDVMAAKHRCPAAMKIIFIE